MTTINLKDFYLLYTEDEFVEVSDEVAAELMADKRYEEAYRRRMFYNKAHYSLDAEDGIEASAIACTTNSPEEMFVRMEQQDQLFNALKSLPAIQARRVEAHFLLGMSQRKIAAAEGVSEVAVHNSIEKGLAAMKKVLKKFDLGG